MGAFYILTSNIHSHDVFRQNVEKGEVVMNSYQFVWNEEQVLLFATEILQIEKLQDNEAVLTTLCARKKYNAAVKMKKNFFRRNTLSRPDPAAFLREMRCYEVPVGTYVDDNSTPLPQDALVIYAMYNIRDTRNAAIALSKEIFTRVTQEPPVSVAGVKSLLFSYLQKSPKFKRWYVIDVDDKSLYDKVLAICETAGVLPKWIVETRGGFHLYLSNSEITREINATLYKALNPLNVEILKDQFTAVPGTRQASFPVTMRKYES
jgi:hypothetical protein